MNIFGPKIIFEVMGIPISETIVASWILIVALTILSIYLTRNLSITSPTKKQLVAEKLYMSIYTLVTDVMGRKHESFVPYIGTLFTFSLTGSLIGLLGARPITADLGTTLGWALVTFFLVQYTNIRTHGTVGWLKSFLHPIPYLLPLNIVSELANPISIAFRHFGNIASGVVITSLVYTALGAIGDLGIPIFQIGLPAVLSIYFDLFTGFLQAYIISMLTMVFISSAAE